MLNIALQLEYNGSNFFGFQKQADVRTIQEVLEAALSKFANQNIQVITAGRTDAGVHALSQVVNFTTTAKRRLYGWVCGINALLPDDIAILKAAVVPKSFNARFDALSRTYYYYLCIRSSRLGTFNRQVGWYYMELDIPKMQEACKLLIGTHDFSSFRASNCQANTPVRNMLEANLEICDDHVFIPGSDREIMLKFTFSANAFLYHMVRNLVGALVYVGKGTLSIDEFQQLLLAKDRRLAPPTFMPDGLYLARVAYADDIFCSDSCDIP